MSVKIRLKRIAKEILGRNSKTRATSYEEQIYQALVQSGDICFDVGANCGSVSSYLAKLVGRTGLITSFEPVWPAYCYLCYNMQSNATTGATVITVPCGLADSERRATIQVPDGEFAMGSMADASAWAQAQPGAKLCSYEIQLLTLDGFLASTASRVPNFIKIDVEGAELFVLRGASELFGAGHRPLMLIEVFAPWERAFGYQPWEPLSLLMGYGYRFLFACPNGLIDYLPTEERPFPPEYEMGANLVAYHPSQHAERIGKLDSIRVGGPGKVLPMVPSPIPNRLAPPDNQ